MGLIGSALGAVGSIFGGISASKAMQKAKQNVKQQARKNQDWYDRRYNEDAENIRNRNRQAAGTQAVMGGTEESVAAAKAANNQALADATAQIAVNGERRKDAIEQQYLERDAELQDKLNDFEIGRAEAISGAVKGVTDAASKMPF